MENLGIQMIVSDWNITDYRSPSGWSVTDARSNAARAEQARAEHERRLMRAEHNPSNPRPSTRSGYRAVSVRPGDTLTAIARQTGTSIHQLLTLNPQITDADMICVGQLVRLP